MYEQIMIMNLQLFGEKKKEETEETKETEDNKNDNIDIQEKYLELQTQLNNLILQNKKLTEQNQNLFLKLTSENAPKEKADSLKEYKDYVGDDFFNSLTNKQQKLLITILKGDDE